MKTKAFALATALLPMLAGSGCATYGPTWSEVSGERYNVTIINRRPTAVQTIDGNGAFATYPIKLDPGSHVIRLAAPAPGWSGGSVVQAMSLSLEPCMRYYLNAQFDNPLSPDWQAVIDYVEPIAGCRTTVASK